MYTLVFDTTAARCSVCLLEKEKIIDKYSHVFDFGQSEALLPAIRNMLQKNNITFSQIKYLFVCVGPGSFTGVRASISAAKIFGLALKDMVVSGFSAFDAYIKLLDEEDIAAYNAVIIETRRDDFYVRFYDKQLKPLDLPQTLSREEIIKYLKKQGVAVTIVGDGVERFLYQPSGLQLHSIKMVDGMTEEALAAVAINQIKDNKFNFPKPLYIRPADVTVNPK